MGRVVEARSLSQVDVEAERVEKLRAFYRGVHELAIVGILTGGIVVPRHGSRSV